MLTIGSVHLESRVMLAPIAGHCDLPFRLVARQCGWPGLAFTDLLCPHGILRQNEQTQWLMATDERDRPLGMQLYGSDPTIMCEAARVAVDQGATTLDINMGCPVDKVTKTFAGSMMLCIPDDSVQLVEALVSAVGDQVPVTAKTRLGWACGELSAPILARRLVNAGIQCLTIHGRTAEQRFKGFIDIAGIRAVVEAVHVSGGGQIPCIGNGDIMTPYDAARMIAATGCDGVMIARAALGAPWLIRDTHHYLEHGELPAELTLRERIECIRQHATHLLAGREERFTLNRLKQKIGVYAKHLGPCKPLKQAIHALNDVQAFDAIFDEFLVNSGDTADQVPVSWAERDAIFQRERAGLGLARVELPTMQTS